MTYDNSNRITSIKYNDFTSAATTWTYTYNNGNTVVTDPLNHQTTYTYDSSGRVTSVLDAVGANYGNTWDANNNQTASTDPSSYQTTRAYDSFNNLKSIQNPTLASGNLGAKSSLTYGSTAHPYLPVSGTDAAGNLIAYSYNTNGDLVSSTNTSAGGTGMGTATKKLQGDPNGSGGTITCGAQPGEVCSSTDANGNTTTYSYDSVGNVLTVTPPGPVTHLTYTYDGLSRVHSYTDGNGSMSTYTYDNFDRSTQITYNSGGTTVTYQYDADGNITQRTDGAGQTNWTYDGYNRVTKLAQSSKADINYTYDNAGNLKTEQGPAGTLTYSYDNANQIAGVHQSTNSADETFVFTDGRPTMIYLPGSITETIGYDRAGRETSIKAVKGTTTLTNFTGSYVNASGNDTALLQSETNNVSGIINTYSYDGLNRLTSATGSGTGSNSFTYTYDNNGNRTQTSKNGTYSTIYGFNAANELTTSGGAASGSYDQNANQLSTGTGLSFGYNTKNQTTSFTPPSSSTINASYLDADQNGRATFGSTTQQNSLLGLYSDTIGSTASYYTHLPTGTAQTLGEVVGGSAYYYLADLRGSTTAATDINGNIVATYKYDPYGTSLSTTGNISNPIRFDGGYYDASTALYKFGERYYNTADARWTQLDPSGQNAGYIFAGNDPVNQVDPTGTSVLERAKDIGQSFALGCAAGAGAFATGVLLTPGGIAAASAAPEAFFGGAVESCTFAGAGSALTDAVTGRDYPQSLFKDLGEGFGF